MASKESPLLVMACSRFWSHPGCANVLARDVNMRRIFVVPDDVRSWQRNIVHTANQRQ